jgi:adenylate kinase
MDLNTVLFLGKPGSGKGTQANLLQIKTDWPIFSSGDMFRALAKEDTVPGRKFRADMHDGLLAPDWFAAYFFEKTILAHPEEQGVIFDGFGRKPPEAKLVIEILKWLGRPFRAVHVKVSDEEIVNRLQKRAETSGRVDDKAIEKRLEEYRAFTEPSIEVFREAGVLVEVQGEGNVEEIQAEIRKQLGIA